MHIKVSFLLGPGSGQNVHDKFYIGIEDDRCPAVIYGSNAPNGSGARKRHSTARDVSGMVSKKSRAEYRVVPPSQINSAAKQNAIDHICQSIPGLDPKKASFRADGITFGDGAPGTSPSGQASERPKRFKKVHAWI